MADLHEQLKKAFELVDKRQNEAALAIINELLAGLTPPDRVGDIPAARATIYDWLKKARRGLAGEPEIIAPKIALRSAMALVH
jgi:hypothetical protein